MQGTEVRVSSYIFVSPIKTNLTGLYPQRKLLKNIFPLTLYCLKLSTHLTQTLNKPDYYQPPYAFLCRKRNQQTKDRVDQHSYAQEVDVSVAFGQYSERYLGQNVAVEERTKYVTL